MNNFKEIFRTGDAYPDTPHGVTSYMVFVDYNERGEGVWTSNALDKLAPYRLATYNALLRRGSTEPYDRTLRIEWELLDYDPQNVPASELHTSLAE